MFSCPACGRSYPPPTRFCSVDGTPLVAPAAAPVAPAVAPANVVPWIVVGVLGLALIALAAFVLTRPQAVAAPAVAAAPVAAPAATPSAPAPVAPAQTAPPPDPAASDGPPPGDWRMVTTPNDGFLSIRSAPDGGGSRLDRMLDGEVIDVLSCGPARVVDGDPGHWCRVRRQNGQTGWAYDAYLVTYQE